MRKIEREPNGAGIFRPGQDLVVAGTIGKNGVKAALSAKEKEISARFPEWFVKRIREQADKKLELTPELFDACGGLREDTYKLIMGGPMMGLAQYNVDVTVGKGTGAMLAFAGKEEQYEEHPQCIRCGKCVGVCPMRLEPVFMYKYLMKGDVDTWQNTLHGMDCIECGACTYICPARLPLIHAFRMGKQKVNNARMAAKAKAEAEKAAAEKKEA